MLQQLNKTIKKKQKTPGYLKREDIEEDEGLPFTEHDRWQHQNGRRVLWDFFIYAPKIHSSYDKYIL